MNNLVSIIVPVYNTEEYVERCVDSLVNQTYSNIEVLLIDDGSTDFSYEKCSSYADRFDSVHVFQKENGGVSSARNYGLKRATGEYIFFVDSDDYLDIDCIRTLISVQKETNADIVVTNPIDVYEDGREVPNNRLKELKILTKNEAVYSFLNVYYYRPECWAKLYRRSIIESVEFDEKMRIAEDSKFFLDAINRSACVAVIPEELYYYAIRSGSVWHSGFSLNYYEGIRYCEELVKVYADSEELLTAAEMKLYRFIMRLLLMKDLPHKDYNIILQKAKKNYRDVQRRLTIKEKVLNFILHHWWIRNTFFLLRYGGKSK